MVVLFENLFLSSYVNTPDWAFTGLGPHNAYIVVAMTNCIYYIILIGELIF